MQQIGVSFVLYYDARKNEIKIYIKVFNSYKLLVAVAAAVVVVVVVCFVVLRLFTDNTRKNICNPWQRKISTTSHNSITVNLLINKLHKEKQS